MFPAFPAHAQPAILRIWQEAYGVTQESNQFCGTPPLIKDWSTKLQIRYTIVSYVLD